jgi:hypothetical protein
MQKNNHNLRKEWDRLRKAYPAIEPKQTPFEKFVEAQGYDLIIQIDKIGERGQSNDTNRKAD